MRYQISEGTTLIGRFPTGKTVTIAVYDLSNGSTVALTGNSCVEIGTTGRYRWNTANITTQPTSRKEYMYIMSEATSGVESDGKFVLGGYPDTIALGLQITQALCGKNNKLYNPTHDDSGNLTGGTIRGYASKADLEADQNHLFELTIAGTYSGFGKVTEHTRKDSV